jgi:F-type H+-transporting ATPase subunit a
MQMTTQRRHTPRSRSSPAPAWVLDPPGNLPAFDHRFDYVAANVRYWFLEKLAWAGLEYLYGLRELKPGTQGSANRVQSRFASASMNGRPMNCCGRRRPLSVAAALVFAAIGSILLAGRSFAEAAESRVQAPRPTAAVTASKAEPDTPRVTIPEKEDSSLPRNAVEIARPFGFPITNSMVVSWVVALGLIIFAQVATRKMKLVPDGAQNLLEWLVGGLYGLLEGIIGRHLVQRTFWFFATVFIFILATNWVGLVPGVGTIGWGHATAHGFKVGQPLLRGANADLNLTLAMAIVFFACWIYWALREVGVRGMAHELFGAKGETAGFMKLLMVVVFFAAGCLEIISILFRPVSLSFRLYGNIFAGENMLETMATLVPGLGWLLPIPFYFLELLVGLVQAMVFMLLTAVFTLLMCQQEEKAPAAAHD